MAKATILLPTTKDRGPILQYSVGSLLKQSEADWELFIIGDGLDLPSTKTAKALAESDPRIRFFPFEKSGSRGEEKRHKLLMQEAVGEIVCYLCDRDLYLPNHIEVMYSLLQNYDIGHSLPTVTLKNGTIKMNNTVLDQRNVEQRELSRFEQVSFGLSIAAHRMDAYKKLPEGWRLTPPGVYTDYYMWEQFLEQDWIRMGISFEPTVIYLPRAGHPGLSTTERVKESELYSRKFCHASGINEFTKALNECLFNSLSAERYDKKMRRQKRKKWFRFGF